MPTVQDDLIAPLKNFAKDSIHLVKKCTKPDKKEFALVASAAVLWAQIGPPQQMWGEEC